MSVLDRFDFEEVEGLRVGIGNRINTACIVYRIEDTVIDTGPANQWAYVSRFLEERDIGQVVITHHHEDHGGNGSRIQKAYRSPIYAHESGVGLNAQPMKIPFYRRVVWGKPRPFETRELPPVVNAGALQFRVVHTPGHSPDMICLFEPRRGWLFSGDAYVATKPKYVRRDEDPNLEIASLTRLLELHFDTLFCAHRGVILNGYEVLRDKLKYLISLREQVRHYMKTGDSIKEITRRVLGKEDFITTISRGDFSKRNYVEAFAAAIRKENMALSGKDPELDML